ncbi:MAG: HAD superfamily hydrolase (TIGR01509 family) [Sphingobacteriales bacterium]|jgi:HAD superfamily hydrolase (TIGR01509 family)
MDGLIIDSEPLWRIAEIEGFKEYGVTITEEECELTMGWRIDEVVEYWEKRRPRSHGSTTDAVNAILDCLCREIEAKGKALPGVMDLMAFLMERKIPMALASSSPMRIINPVVEKLNLAPFMREIRSAEFEEFGKPHPSVFIKTADALQMDYLDCLVLEDSVNGVIAAKAAKMACIAIPASHHLQKKEFGIADGVYSSASDLLIALQKDWKN